MKNIKCGDKDHKININIDINMDISKRKEYIVKSLSSVMTHLLLNGDNVLDKQFAESLEEFIDNSMKLYGEVNDDESDILRDFE